MSEADAASRATAWRILLVDDDPHIRVFAAKVLERAFPNALVLAAGDGPEALEILATEDVDLVISDYRMPKMDGATFLAQARTLSPATMRCLLTGQTETEVASRSVNEGRIHAYHEKPIDAATLTALASRLLREGAAGRKRGGPFPADPSQKRTAPFTGELGRDP